MICQKSIKIFLIVFSIISLSACLNNSKSNDKSSRGHEGSVILDGPTKSINLTARFDGECDKGYGRRFCSKTTTETKLAVSRAIRSESSTVFTAAFMGGCSLSSGRRTCNQTITENKLALSASPKTGSSMALTAAFIGGCSQAHGLKICGTSIVVSGIASSLVPKN